MDESTNTGTEYPTIELEGKTYEIKFTRAAMYRLDNAGVTFAPRFTPKGYSVGIANLINTLHVVIGFQGSHEDLAELAYDKRDEIGGKLVEAWGKVVLPSFQAKASALAAAKATAEDNPPVLQ